MKKFITFLLSMTMLFSLCSCSLLQQEEEIEVPTKRDALKAAEEEYNLDLDFVSEDISKHEDEATWVFVNEEVREDGSSTTTTVTVTWSANHPDRFRFDDDVTYVEPLTIIEETPTPTPTLAPTEPSETDVTEYVLYTPGYIDGDVYINDSFGFSVDLPDGWSFATNSQLSQLGYIVAENIAEGEWRDQLENGSVIAEFYMYSPDNSNINMTVGVNNGNYTEEDIIQSAIDTLQVALANMINIDEITTNTYTIDGTTFYGMELVGSGVINDIEIHERQIVLISDSGMIGTITIASTTSDGLDIIYDVFHNN